MKFQEIDLTFEPILEENRIPIEIEVIFKYSIWEGKFYKRFLKIKGPNYTSFAFYADYWNFIEEWKKDLVFGENGEPIEDKTPYYEAYSKGFMDGYFEFENEVKEINQVFNQNSFTGDAIFKETKQEFHAFSSRGYFYKSDDAKENPIPILKKELLYGGGVKVGRNYKAWFYIIKNPKPFIQLFREFYLEWFELYENEFRKGNSHINVCSKGISSPLQIVIDEIRTKDTGEVDQKSESMAIENKFNQMPIKAVRSYFLPLIEKDNPKGIMWMTEENFDIFLKRSFGKDESLNKPKINLGHGAKYAIIKLFYQFYDCCQIEYYNENRSKEPFLNLLKDAFLTKEFDNLDTSNFKSKSKYQWD